LPNLSSIQAIVGSIERSYSQNIRPRAKKFLVRSTCLLVRPRLSSARELSVPIGMENRFQDLSEPSTRGLLV